MTQIIIKSHHIEITKSIKEYVEKKLEKMDHFFDKIEEIQVDLEIEKVSNEDDRQISSATVFVPGSAIIAKESSKDLYASIDGMLDKLLRQLKKYKQKMRLTSRKKAMKTKRHIQTMNLANSDSKQKNNTKPSPFIKKPMHPEDAALLLEENEQSFLVFRNAKDEHINVIYITDDGDFGLIET